MAKKITLFCSVGMSPSLLVNKMREAAKKNGKDYEINAYSLSEADAKGADADVILLGPQVRFALSKMKGLFPNKPVDVIDMRSYGLMDGAAALALAEKHLK